MNAGLEEIANRAVDRLAELAAGYIGEGRNCSECGEWKVWGKFSNRKDGKNGKRAECKSCFAEQKRQRRRGITRSVRERPAVLVCRGKCGRELPFDRKHFRNVCKLKWGLGTQCKPCVNDNDKVVCTLKKKHPKAEAGGRCYACNKETDKLVLDHDHETDEFRGWACHSCNHRLALPYSKLKA